jgi:hypothetical protein
MSEYNVNRMGSINGGADSKELFLKVFSGEVMTTFEAEAVFKNYTRVRTLSSGKSAQFPFIGNISAGYHSPGTEMIGNDVNHAERVINVDQLLTAHVSIANIDEAMNHYDVRQPYTTEIGRALAYAMDTRLARVIARAARTGAVLNDTRYPTYGASGAGTTGAVGSDADNADLRANDADSNATSLISRVWNAAKIFDNKNVPQAGRYLALRPAQYYLLLQAGNSMTTSLLLNKDVGGEGSYARANLPMVAGFSVVKSVHIPTGNFTSEASTATGGNNYNGNFSSTVALAWQGECVGTVKLLDISSESEYSVARQATLMVSKYAMGHGVLRPECAAEIATTAVTTNFLPTA